MKTSIDDLRNHLFETIEMLKDGDARMDLAKAKTIADVSQVIINSAKAETDRVVATKRLTQSQLIPLTDQSPEDDFTPPAVTGPVRN